MIREYRISRVVFAIMSPFMGGYSKWNILEDDELTKFTIDTVYEFYDSLWEVTPQIADPYIGPIDESITYTLTRHLYDDADANDLLTDVTYMFSDRLFGYIS